MLILIAPKFHPRHCKPRIADTDSATIPVYRYYRYRRYYYIIFVSIVAVAAAATNSLYLQQIAIAACRYATIAHYLAAVVAIAAAPLIIFLLPPAVIRYGGANTATRAAVAYRRYSRYRCSLPLLPLSRIQSPLCNYRYRHRREYNRYRCSAIQSQPSLAPQRRCRFR